MAALTGSGMAKLVPGVVAVMGRHVEGWAQAGRVELYEAVRGGAGGKGGRGAAGGGGRDRVTESAGEGRHAKE